MRGCRKLDLAAVITCYHPFIYILLVSFCVLPVCISNENIMCVTCENHFHYLMSKFTQHALECIAHNIINYRAIYYDPPNSTDSLGYLLTEKYIFFRVQFL